MFPDAILDPMVGVPCDRTGPGDAPVVAVRNSPGRFGWRLNPCWVVLRARTRPKVEREVCDRRYRPQPARRNACTEHRLARRSCRWTWLSSVATGGWLSGARSAPGRCALSAVGRTLVTASSTAVEPDLLRRSQSRVRLFSAPLAFISGKRFYPSTLCPKPCQKMAIVKVGCPWRG